jgi:hypothetical protein
MLEFTKPHDDVVAAFKKMITNPIVTEREENGATVTDIEGNFSHFVMEDLETWQAYIKIEITDNRIKDDNDREARSILAAADPGGFGRMLFVPTIAHVYKRVETVTHTKTITERREDGVVVSTEESEETTQPEYTWKEITREFGSKVRPNNR